MSDLYTQKIELSNTFRQWTIKYNAALDRIAEIVASKIADYSFMVYKGVHVSEPIPAPEIDPNTQNTVPQTVVYTRSWLEGSVRITQHVAVDHTGEEILIYETTEVL